MHSVEACIYINGSWNFYFTNFTCVPLPQTIIKPSEHLVKGADAQLLFEQ